MVHERQNNEQIINPKPGCYLILTETAVMSVAPSTTIMPFRAASWANSAEVFPASSNGIIFGSFACTVFDVPSSHNFEDVDKAATLILLLIAIEDLAKAFP